MEDDTDGEVKRPHSAVSEKSPYFSSTKRTSGTDSAHKRPRLLSPSNSVRLTDSVGDSIPAEMVSTPTRRESQRPDTSVGVQQPSPIIVQFRPAERKDAAPTTELPPTPSLVSFPRTHRRADKEDAKNDSDSSSTLVSPHDQSSSASALHVHAEHAGPDGDQVDADSPEIQVIEIASDSEDFGEDLMSNYLDIEASFPSPNTSSPNGGPKWLAASIQQGVPLSLDTLQELVQWFRSEELVPPNLRTTMFKNYSADRSEFARQIAMVFLRLAQSRVKLDVECDRQHFQRAMGELLGGLVAWALRVFEAVTQAITSQDAVRPILAVAKILLALRACLEDGERSMLKFITQAHGIDAYQLRLTLQGHMFQLEGTSALHDLLQLLLTRNLASSEMLENIHFLLNFIIEFVQHNANMGGMQPDLPIARTFLRLARTIMKKLDGQIAKEEDILPLYVRMLYTSLLKDHIVEAARFSEELAAELCGALIDLPNDMDKADLPYCLGYTDFVTLLKRYISRGYMKLRVSAVQSLRDHLIETYHRWGVNTVEVHPFIVWTADLLTQQRIVDAILGIDSHPELISRATQIIEFLLLARRFTQQHSDMLWTSVVNSQDHRVSTATLNVLIGLFRTPSIQPDHILMLCESINSITPLPQPTAQLREVLHELCQKISAYGPTIFGQQHSGLPLSLCFRLLRYTSTIESCTESANLRNFMFRAVQQLRLNPEMPQKVRRQFVRELLQDISEDTSSSLSAMHALCATCVPVDAASESLIDEFALPSIICKSISTFVAQGFAQMRDREYATYSLECLLDFLFQIIEAKPKAFSQELIADLFDHLVGSKAVSDHIRARVWDHLALLIHRRRRTRSPTQNQFTTAAFAADEANALGDIQTHLRDLDRIIGYWADASQPLIDSTFVTEPFFEFLKAITYLRINVAQASDLRRGGRLLVPCEGLLWRTLLIADSKIAKRLAAFIASLYLEVELYLQASGTKTMDRELLHQTHSGLVDRCLTRLEQLHRTARSGEDRTMINVDDVEQDAKSPLKSVPITDAFHRTLMVLMITLNMIQKQPRFMTEESAETAQLCLVPLSTSFETLTILKYQLFLPGKGPEAVEEVQLSDVETRGDLHDYFTNITGTSNFTTIWGGAVINLLSRPYQTLRGFNASSRGLIMVRVQDSWSSENPPDIEQSIFLSKGASVFEHHIIRNFHRFHRFLDSSDIITQESFRFLNCFRPDGSIAQLWLDGSVDSITVFPKEQPFMGLYALRCLSWLLSQEKGTMNLEACAHALQLLCSTLMDPAFFDPGLKGDVEIRLATNISCCLLDLLTHPFTQEHSVELKAEELVYRMIGICNMALDADWPVKATSVCFALLVRFASYSEATWTAFSDTLAVNTLLQRLFTNPASAIRVDVSDLILHGVLLTEQNDDPIPPSETYVRFLWRKLTDIVDRSIDFPDVAHTLIDTTRVVWDSFKETNELRLSNNSDLARALSKWHQHLTTRVCSHDESDYLRLDEYAFSMGRLINLCLWETGGWENAQIQQKYVSDMFQKLLFPALQPNYDPRHGDLPVCHDRTREHLLESLQALIYDQACSERKSDTLLQCIGFISKALDSEYHSYLPKVDRNNFLKSSAGFTGLFNMGATCYANSLTAQLFMNPTFRQLMIEAPQLENTTSSLLKETQRCFSYQQNSCTKALSISSLISSVRMIDGSNINPYIQMDVEEFFNLLFDQWESQFISPELKARFRSIYGGKQVMQTKSKECKHISERDESFYNIQCTLDGVSCLEDSLAQLVTGEEMEGDNKYKCESCDGKFVNAVRRACFKELPDNLIFHLMRFTYDVFAQQRAKNNNFFSFPTYIDMSAYKYETLSNPDANRTPDYFELVGVLLHAGSADSGHYISYVRLPGESSEGTDRWIEFDDDEVREYSAAKIPDRCFGGEAEGKMGMVSMKTHCAYMLFYQRSSGPDSTRPSVVAKPSASAKVPIPLELADIINRENIGFLQDYCLSGSGQYGFITRIFEYVTDRITLRDSEPDPDDDGIYAELTESTVNMACGYIWRVLSRMPDKPLQGDKEGPLKEIVERFKRLAGHDCTAWALLLNWFTKNQTALMDLILRRQPKVHTTFLRLIRLAVTTLWNSRADDFFGYDSRSTSPIAVDAVRSSPFYAFMRNLQEVTGQVEFYNNGVEDWGTLFDALKYIANINTYFAAVMIDLGYLHEYLRLFISAFPRGELSPECEELWSYPAFDAISRNHEAQQPGLAWATLALLKHVTMDAEQAATAQDRLEGIDFSKADAGVVLTKDEMNMLVANNSNLLWFHRFLTTTWMEANHPRSAAAAVTELLVQKGFPSMPILINNLEFGTSRCFSSWIRAAFVIIATDDETMVTATHLFDSIIGAAAGVQWNHRGGLRQFFRQIHDSPVMKHWQSRMALTAAVWGPPLLDDPDGPEDDNIWSIIIDLLNKKWLRADGTIHINGSAIIQVIRSLMNECFERFTQFVQGGSSREELRDHYNVMRMCYQNLQLLHQLDDLPEDYADTICAIKDTELMSFYTRAHGLFSNLPDSMEEDEAGSEEGFSSAASNASDEV